MSNDSKSSSLPPSVGEFAIEDRQRLLGRIAELEEALELADRGVANCEVFRQRLAKYEDAEGRPVVVGDCAGLIGGLRELADHVFNHEHRLIVATADALESQVREVAERCAKICDERAAYYDDGDDDRPNSRRAIACKACADVIRYAFTTPSAGSQKEQGE